MSSVGNFDSELFFAALADRTRLRLLNLMRDGEVCVCFFAETFGTNNPKIFRHLSYPKRAGLVIGRRDGKWMHYRINPPTDPAAAEVYKATMQMARKGPSMRADANRYGRVCCDLDMPVRIGRLGLAESASSA